MLDERSGTNPPMNDFPSEPTEKLEPNKLRELKAVKLRDDIASAKNSEERAGELLEQALLDETSDTHAAVQLLLQRRAEYTQALQDYLDFLENKDSDID